MTSANELANYLSKLSLENSTRSTRSPPRSTRSSPRSSHIGSLPENVIRHINGHDFGQLYWILDHARFMRAMKGLRMAPFRFNKRPPYRIFYDPKYQTLYRNGNVF